MSADLSVGVESCLECRLAARVLESPWCHQCEQMIGVDAAEEILNQMATRDAEALEELRRKRRQDEQYAGHEDPETGRPLRPSWPAPAKAKEPEPLPPDAGIPLDRPRGSPGHRGVPVRCPGGTHCQVCHP
jgi:hypothetical protein